MTDDRESLEQLTHLAYVRVQCFSGSLQPVMQPSRRRTDIVAGEAFDKTSQGWLGSEKCPRSRVVSRSR